MAKTVSKRIQILSESEINELYGIPSLNHSEREDYFSLDKETHALVKKCRRLETKVYFILLLGYFRCKPIVFNFSFNEVKADVDFILHKYFDDQDFDRNDLSPTSKTNLVNRLTSYTGYNLYQTKKHKVLLLER